MVAQPQSTYPAAVMTVLRLAERDCGRQQKLKASLLAASAFEPVGGVVGLAECHHLELDASSIARNSPAGSIDLLTLRASARWVHA